MNWVNFQSQKSKCAQRNHKKKNNKCGYRKEIMVQKMDQIDESKKNNLPNLADQYSTDTNYIS